VQLGSSKSATAKLQQWLQADAEPAFTPVRSLVDFWAARRNGA
jgi:hypothetical protein